MGKGDEAIHGYTGEGNNCDVRIVDPVTGASLEAEAFIPVFAGAAIVALFDLAISLRVGHEVQRLPDGRRFRVAELLRQAAGGRINVRLEEI